MKEKIWNLTKNKSQSDLLWQIIPITLILLLATGLYLYQLGTESFWIDELISVDRAKKDILTLLWEGRLSNILLKGWMLFGYSDSWLRGLCVVFTLGSVLLTYRLGCRLASKPVGLISALFVAISPLFIHHAQEVRMYGVSTFFGLLGTLALTSALESPNKFSISIWAIARYLAIRSTRLNLLLLLPDIVLFGWKFRKQKRVLLSFVAGLTVIILLWSPMVINVATSSADFMGGFRETVETGVENKVETGVENKVETGVENKVENKLDKKPPPTIISVLLQPGSFTAWPFGRANSTAIFWFYNLYSIMVAGLIGLAFFEKRNSHKLGWAAAWGFLPLIPIFLVSQISRSIWVNRYLMFTAPYIFILLAVGFMVVWRRWRIPAVAIALIYFVAIGGGLKRYYTVLDREDWRGIVQSIQSNEQSGDLIVWKVGRQTIPRALNHYYSGSATIEVRNVGPEDNPQDVKRWLQSLPKTKSRIWLVYAHPSPNLVSAIKNQFKVEKYQKIPPVNIFLLRPATSEIQNNN